MQPKNFFYSRRCNCTLTVLMEYEITKINYGSCHGNQRLFCQT